MELSIKWNNIQQVNSLDSTGQFMPLFISIAQFVTTIWALAKSGFEIMNNEEEFLESSKSIFTIPTHPINMFLYGD